MSIRHATWIALVALLSNGCCVAQAREVADLPACERQITQFYLDYRKALARGEDTTDFFNAIWLANGGIVDRSALKQEKVVRVATYMEAIDRAQKLVPHVISAYPRCVGEKGIVVFQILNNNVDGVHTGSYISVSLTNGLITGIAFAKNIRGAINEDVDDAYFVPINATFESR